MPHEELVIFLLVDCQEFPYIYFPHFGDSKPGKSNRNKSKKRTTRNFPGIMNTSNVKPTQTPTHYNCVVLHLLRLVFMRKMFSSCFVPFFFFLGLIVCHIIMKIIGIFFRSCEQKQQRKKCVSFLR